jgi:polyisoprenoid-binding protein YceI
MASVAVQPFVGTYRAQPVPSSFAFAVRHSGVFWYRGSLSDVAATLRCGGDGLALEGSARVDSISVVEPAAMRASVLGPEFFDAERHPEITFRSAEVRLADDGGAEVDGELTIRGVTRPVGASGHYAPPRQSSFGEIAGLQLRRASTAANSDSIGRWSSRAVATRSAGMWGWTSICCSRERTQALTDNVEPSRTSGSAHARRTGTPLRRPGAGLVGERRRLLGG